MLRCKDNLSQISERDSHDGFGHTMRRENWSMLQVERYVLREMEKEQERLSWHLKVSAHGLKCAVGGISHACWPGT